MIDHYETARLALDAAQELLGRHDYDRAEALFSAYLSEDDGSLQFLTAVRLPLLHMLGRLYFQTGRYLAAKRTLRDAYALSEVFPGNMPAQDADERARILDFLKADVGLELSD